VLLGENQPDMKAWPADRAKWEEAAGTVARHGVIVTPFEAKALFVIAGIRQRGETALFERGRHAFLDAYGALAAAIESLGPERGWLSRQPQDRSAGGNPASGRVR